MQSKQKFHIYKIQPHIGELNSLDGGIKNLEKRYQIMIPKSRSCQAARNIQVGCQWSSKIPKKISNALNKNKIIYKSIK